MDKALLIRCGTLLLVTLLSPSQQGWADNFRTRSHQTLNSNEPLASDVEAEIRFGRQVAARILARQPPLNNTELTRYVGLVGTSLSLYSPRPELNFHFAILDDTAVNAYSAPGGYIFISKAAISLAQDEAELAAILAHEIAHVTEKHIVNELNIKGSDTDSLSGLALFLGGSGNSSRIALTQSVDKAVNILFEDGYKVAEELNADRIALTLLAQSGYDPTALRRFLQRADALEQNAKNQTTPQSTHPRSTERFSQIESLIKQEGLDQPTNLTLKDRFEQHVK